MCYDALCGVVCLMAGAHHHGDYQRRARLVTAAANADPTTVCWRCGRPLDAHAAHRNGRRPWWTAGHVVDGDPTSMLLPEASTCNFAAGGRIGIGRMRRKQMIDGITTTRRW